jgi:uncharacterized membrane protein HdeD (DUF308 family)
MNIIKRATAPTPKFFKTLRNVGLILLAVSGSILAAPVALPAIVVTVAGYAAVAGGVISAVSQVTVSDQAKAAERQNPEAANVHENRRGYDPDIYRE